MITLPVSSNDKKYSRPPLLAPARLNILNIKDLVRTGNVPVMPLLLDNRRINIWREF
jgi:hypothetical protein